MRALRKRGSSMVAESGPSRTPWFGWFGVENLNEKRGYFGDFIKRMRVRVSAFALWRGRLFEFEELVLT